MTNIDKMKTELIKEFGYDEEYVMQLSDGQIIHHHKIAEEKHW